MLRSFIRFYLLPGLMLLAALALAACATTVSALSGGLGDPPATATPTPLQPVLPTLTFTPVPTPTLTPEPSPTACREMRGSVQRLELETEQLSRPLAFRLYLPPCYDAGRSGGYPLLILLHGQSASDELWDSLGADETADALITAGQAAPFLIAMPYEEYYLMDMRQSTFPDAIVQSLVPWIDAHYNTCAQRECRAIGGISRGAIWAVRLGFMHWDVFSIVGAHSYPGNYYNFSAWLQDIPQDAVPRVYADIGQWDPYVEDATQLNALLEGYDIPHEWHLNPGTHNEEYWSSHVEEYLRWYTSTWKETP
ncbi:MAG: esterase family protein [Chloroflexi bacterium]|nr:alpha/beta hydrolase-fold protein [Anaerolineaceae bacterium]NMB88697.1 esterase family protein [Chloroflexota bacterium]